MELSGEYRIPASRERVWQALNDPEVLRACIPGAEALEKLSETEFLGTVNARVGPVQARFKGKVSLSDLDPPSGYTIAGEGQGGVAGFAKGSARVSLKEDAGATLLAYRAEAQVGGKLAQIGSRLIAGVAKKMADEFFGSFAERLGGAAVEAPAAAPAPARPALRPLYWLVGLLVLIALLLWIVA